MHGNQWHKGPNPCEARREEVLALYREQVGLYEMGRRLKIHVRRIGEFLKSEGLDRRKFWRPNACDKNKDLVLEMARNMRSLNDIARKIGCNSRHVRQFLDREGVVREYLKNYGGERSPKWKGGRHKNHHGYIYVWSPDHPKKNHLGYVLEHRLVMEKAIGRLLLPNEVVHHRNGVRDDNRIENLQLFSENNEHLRHELKGRVPNWTPDGLERMKKGVARNADQRRGTNDWHWRTKLKHGVQPLRGKKNYLKA